MTFGSVGWLKLPVLQDVVPPYVLREASPYLVNFQSRFVDRSATITSP